MTRDQQRTNRIILSGLLSACCWFYVASRVGPTYTGITLSESVEMLTAGPVGWLQSL